MPRYKHKDAATLAYNANKKRLRAEAQIVLDGMMNDALNEMTRNFNAALNRGQILTLSLDRDQVKKLLRGSSQRVLGS